MRRLCVSLFLLFCVMQTVANQRADLIVYSYDRPMQLYALLESVEKYVTGLQDIIVIYRVSSDDFDRSYRIVQERFPQVNFWPQHTKKNTFKGLTMRALHKGKQAHILFAVDDIIVTDYVDIALCVDAMESFQAYGFFLRLGLHLSYCYTMKQIQHVPKHVQLCNDIYGYYFKDGMCDWNYPHTLDMTLYRKIDLLDTFKTMIFKAPNSLEGRWATFGSRVQHEKGLFFEHAKIVNIPLNRVQQECNNHHMNSYTPVELLHLFEQGYKIDIDSLYKIDNCAAHMDYTPSLIRR